MSAAKQSLICGDEERRTVLAKHKKFQGIDYVEVATEPSAINQLLLRVYFIAKTTQDGQDSLSAMLKELDGAVSKVRIQGGVRIKNLKTTAVTHVADDRLDVRVNRYGDFSSYTLAIDHASLDPPYARCTFSFKAGCPSPLDCRPRETSVLSTGSAPAIDYMAKDYASFHRALLDFMTTRVPDWKERNPADLGIALVELLAYAGDQLSYYQDAVANETTLETARRRISLRRHARLFDYHTHDGVSARTFVQFRVGKKGKIAKGTRVLSRITRPLGTAAPGKEIEAAQAAPAMELADATFETLAEAWVHPSLQDIPVYTWGNEQCCLPKGTTALDLQGDLAFEPDSKDAKKSEPWRLKSGDFLLLEEVIGPATGNKADADPEHRQVVRLTKVQAAQDPLKKKSLTRVTWDQADALGFPLCLSARVKEKNIADLGLAQGNLILADHGRPITKERHSWDAGVSWAVGTQTRSRTYRFRLEEGPLSFGAPLPKSGEPARSLRTMNPRKAEPRIGVAEVRDGTTGEKWKPGASSLLDSGRFDRDFVVETDNDGRALLRFGDNQYGMAPADDTDFQVDYRIGVGRAGNIGADALGHVIQPNDLSGWPQIEQVRNPLPAWGGTGPESLEQVKQLAPAACHAGLLRAVTAADYAAVAAKHPEVSGAVAGFRWTGSWHTVFLSIDPRGRAELTAGLARRVRRWVQRFTQTGYDLEIRQPVYVPLEIEADVCAALGHFRAHVLEALLDALSARDLADGSRGFFHPDNLSFGEPVYLSRLYTAMEAVDGVDSVEIKTFKRLGEVSAGELKKGRIAMDRLEVARLDNDPSFPERGLLHLVMMGGK